jgi:lactase-phlorizin hydrolase
LPKFTDEEKALIFRSSDFIGVNHYTARIIGNKVKPPSDVSVVADRDTVASVDDDWPT